MPEELREISGPEAVPRPTPLFEAAVVASLALALLSVALFAWLGREVLSGDTARFDELVRSRVHQLASPAMTSVMRAISLLGYEVLLAEVIVALVVFVRLRWKRGAIWLFIAMAGSVLLDAALKYFYHRPRPAPFFGSAAHYYSFPSGHALSSFCFYGVMAGLLSARIKPLRWRIVIWTAAALLVMAIGTSRIYLGVHYPSDVMAGYLAASVWVGAIIVLDHLRKVRFARKRRPGGAAAEA